MWIGIRPFENDRFLSWSVEQMEKLLYLEWLKNIVNKCKIYFAIDRLYYYCAKQA